MKFSDSNSWFLAVLTGLVLSNSVLRADVPPPPGSQKPLTEAQKKSLDLTQGQQQEDIRKLEKEIQDAYDHLRIEGKGKDAVLVVGKHAIGIPNDVRLVKEPKDSSVLGFHLIVGSGKDHFVRLGRRAVSSRLSEGPGYAGMAFSENDAKFTFAVASMVAIQAVEGNLLLVQKGGVLTGLPTTVIRCEDEAASGPRGDCVVSIRGAEALRLFALHGAKLGTTHGKAEFQCAKNQQGYAHCEVTVAEMLRNFGKNLRLFVYFTESKDCDLLRRVLPEGYSTQDGLFGIAAPRTPAAGGQIAWCSLMSLDYRVQ